MERKKNKMSRKKGKNGVFLIVYYYFVFYSNNGVSMAVKEVEKIPGELETLWHSTSHVMAAAVKELFPEAKFAIGPPIKNGFYYDFEVKEPFTPEDLGKIEKKMKEIVKRNEKFERKEISKKEALELFKNEPYKTELIKELGDEKISIYSNGKFTDLCRGPHIKNAGEIKAFKLLKAAGAYWRGSEKNKMLQRIYGISFRKREELDAYLKKLKEMGERNHIKLGKELDLFSVHPEAPGFPFIHGKGTVLWREMEKLWIEEHSALGYEIVQTPMILSKDLWLQSGHWDHYREHMYFVDIDDHEFAVKPMNCPGGILVYRNKRHSYRDLPIKMAELGTVHRHEKSGVLMGLFRVRKFTQDDAHVYCTEEQLKDQIIEIIELTIRLYKKFGFEDFKIEVSTKPEKAMGSDEVWEHATKALRAALEELKLGYTVNEGEGAFYGPKIDFHIKDSLEREWQCATIQVDFSMPEKFGLYYISKEDKKERPVMIHRALLGSFERFMGILIEHYGGAFPLWLSPVQVKVLNVADRHLDYAKKIEREMFRAGIRTELDKSQESVGKKVRTAAKEKIPFIAVVGDEEEKKKAVTVRDRTGKMEKNIPVPEFIERLKKSIEKREN